MLTIEVRYYSVHEMDALAIYVSDASSKMDGSAEHAATIGEANI